MNNSEAASHRYRPPSKFLPSSPLLSNGTKSSLVCGATTTSTPINTNTTANGHSTSSASPRIRYSAFTEPTAPPIMARLERATPRAYTNVTESTTTLSSPRTDEFLSASPCLQLPPVHTRQRSMPTDMPSFYNATNKRNERQLVALDSNSNARLGGGHSNQDAAYNLVIDIHVHAPDPSEDGMSRMTQSLITYNPTSLDEGLIEPTMDKTNSLDHLDREFIGDACEYSTHRELLRLSDGLAKLAAGDETDVRLSAEDDFDSAENGKETPPSQKINEPIQCNNNTRFLINGLNVRTQTPIARRRLLVTAATETGANNQLFNNRPARSSSVCEPRFDTSWAMRDQTRHHRTEEVDVAQLIRLLQSPEQAVVENATACLQHIVYHNSSLKEKTRQCGGIAILVKLLYSENMQISENVVSVLRNLTCGDNLEIKEELERVGGIRALAWLIENRQGSLYQSDSIPRVIDSRVRNSTILNSSTPTGTRTMLDSAAAILCNIASVNHLKRSVLLEAVLPSLVGSVVRPAIISKSQDRSQESLANSILFRNVVAVIRNVSSAESTEVRDRLRKCPRLLESLITVFKEMIHAQCFDTKSVEHCVCCMRNLCYSLHTSIEVDERVRDARKLSLTSNPRNSITLGRFRRKSSLSLTQKLSDDNAEEQLPGPNRFPPGSVLNIFCHTETLRTLTELLHSSSNPCTLEAAAGTIQNLAAGNWSFSESVRQTIRSLQCLPILVELLNAPARRVATAAANALRNLALEPRTCQLLGKHAFVRILTALTHCTPSLVVSGPRGSLRGNDTAGAPAPRPEWRVPTEAKSGSLLHLSLTQLPAHSQSVYSARSVAAALLNLCCVLTNKQLDNARRFVTFGGAESCLEILTVTRDHMDVSIKFCDEYVSVERVNRLAKQLLRMLWEFTELRPIFKLAGWTETDFGISKRPNRFSSLVRRRSKTSQDRQALSSRFKDSNEEKRPELNRMTHTVPMTRDSLGSINDTFSTLGAEDLVGGREFDGMESDQSPYEDSSGTLRNGQNDRLRWSEVSWSESVRPKAVYVPSADWNRTESRAKWTHSDKLPFDPDTSATLRQHPYRKTRIDNYSAIDNNTSTRPKLPDSWV